MLFHVRTSRNTGVSLGCFGTAVIGLGFLMLLALPLYVLDWAFSRWYTAPLGVLAIVLVVLAVLGAIFERD